MKKTILSFVILLSTIFHAIGQINPVTNLTLQNQYDFGNYYFGLEWDEPNLPHNEIIGYNIYRDNELYRFQTERYVANIGTNPNCGQDFMQFYSDDDGFYIHVTAVYNEGQLESNYSETVFAQNNLLTTDNFNFKTKQILYPNPSNGVINVLAANLTKVIIYDITGKQIKEIEPQLQIKLFDLPKGIYLIKLFSNNEVNVHKIILE